DPPVRQPVRPRRRWTMSLRIGMLCHDSVGGSARIGLELSTALARRGHEIHLFARRPPLGVVDHPDGLHLHTLRATRAEHELTPRLDVNWPRGEIDALVRLVTTVSRAVQLDILHSHYAVHFIEVAERARRRLDASAPALVATLHGTDVELL